MNLRSVLEQRMSAAMVAAGLPDGTPAVVAPSSRPEFGDYQANGVMSAAKKQKTNPRQLAEQVVASADLDDLTEPLEVAGPGFINIRLKGDYLAHRLDEALGDDRLGATAAAEASKVVVDYSSPNLAKEMHVGHLRSTIIGDALARVLEFLGCDVIRQNHVGDWGTQFGMLTAYLDRCGAEAASDLGDLEEFYKKSKRLFDEDEQFAQVSREYVVKLQGGDREVAKKWQAFIDVSLAHCQEIYRRLGIGLTRDDVRAESFYNDDLPKVVADLDAAGLLKESAGAQCVFLPEFVGKDDELLPVIVQKTGGGYLYATSDLAAMRFRTRELHAGRILYVTDFRQGLHFRQVFAVARAASFVGDDVSLEHVAFGTMMGADNKPFKTREGGTVKLMDLLDEAELKAAELVADKNPDLPSESVKEIAGVVGIGAVKYADLAHNRNSDYVFAWDKMLAMDGNTAPYMQYAYARIKSIFRKHDAASGDRKQAAINIGEPAERTLAMKLAQFPETLDTVAAECLPHLLCGYLFELAGAFMSFYENCPVLQAVPATRDSRLTLCDLTARTIRTGLALLGIEVIEQM